MTTKGPKSGKRLGPNGLPILTLRQQKFVDAYLGEARGNGTEAARIAGYKGHDDTLRNRGSANLKLNCIQLHLMHRRRQNPLVMTREDRQAFWTRVALGQELDRDGKPPKMADRLKASQLLGKTQLDFVERVQLEAPEGGKPLKVTLETLLPKSPSLSKDSKDTDSKDTDPENP